MSTIASKENIRKLVILSLFLVGFVLIGGYTIVGSLLFWSGGLLILPGIVLIISFNSFEGNRTEKLTLSILPWLILLIVSHIYIRNSTDPLAGLLNQMMIISLFLGTLLTFIRKKTANTDIDLNEKNLNDANVDSSGKEVLLVFGFIAGLFTIVFAGSWIYYFLSKYLKI